MGVRDEDGVEPAERVDLDGAAVAPQMGDTATEDRVGEDADAVELDQRRGMADVGQGIRV